MTTLESASPPATPHPPAPDPDEVAMHRLAEPTPPDAICQREGQKKTILSFIKESFIKYRLNNVLGSSNWQADTTMGASWARTVLTVQLPSGKIVMRSGVSGYDTKGGKLAKDDVNVVKTAATDSFKRAAWMFGIGADLRPQGVYGGSADDEDHEHPEAAVGQAPRREPTRPPSGGWGSGNRGEADRGPARGNGHAHGPPRSGKALFAWGMDEGKALNVDLVKWINKWAQAKGYPARMVDFDERQVGEAYEAATRKLSGQRERQPVYSEDDDSDRSEGT